MPLAAPDARRQAVSGNITARRRAEACLLGLGEGLWLTGNAIDSSKAPGGRGQKSICEMSDNEAGEKTKTTSDVLEARVYTTLVHFLWEWKASR